MPKKARLNLTVIPDFKRKANKLARERRRSVSALFEDLIDEEWQRTGKAAAAAGKKSRKKPPPPTIGFFTREGRILFRRKTATVTAKDRRHEFGRSDRR